MPEMVNISVAFVHGPKRAGRVTRITVPAERDMSVKDVREYILKCAKGEDGTENDREAVTILVEKSGVGIESLSTDPIQIIQAVMGTFMEADLPNCPIVEDTSVLFMHSEPIL